jgi:hypothetical protein
LKGNLRMKLVNLETFTTLKNWRVLPLAACLVFSACGGKSSKSPSSGVSDTVVDGAIPTSLGKGINTLTGKIKGKCVDLGGLIDGADNTAGQGNTASSQKVTTEILDITTLTQLRESLGIDATASFNTAYGDYSGKMSFAQKLNLNSESRYLMVRTKVKNTIQLEKNPVYTQTVQDAIKNGKLDAEAFLKECGNEYVYSVTKGGEFIGVFEFEMNSKEESTKFTSNVKADFGIGNVTNDVSYALDRFKKNTLRQIRMYRSGGQGQMPDPKNLEQFAIDFPSIVKNISDASPDILQYGTREYVGIAPLGLQPNVVGLQGQKQIIQNLANDRDRALLSLNSVGFILSELNKYETPTEDLEKTSENLRNFINQINTSAIACFEDYKACNMPIISFPKVVLPKKLPPPVVGDSGWKRVNLPGADGWSMEYPTRGFEMTSYQLNSRTGPDFETYFDVTLKFPPVGVYSNIPYNIYYTVSVRNVQCDINRDSLATRAEFNSVELNSPLKFEVSSYLDTSGFFFKSFGFVAKDLNSNECVHLYFHGESVDFQIKNFGILSSDPVALRIRKIVESLQYKKVK